MGTRAQGLGVRCEMRLGCVKVNVRPELVMVKVRGSFWVCVKKKNSLGIKS